MNTTDLLDATTRNIITFPADFRVSVSSITGMGDFPVALAAPAAEDRGTMTLGELAQAMADFAAQLVRQVQHQAAAESGPGRFGEVA